VADRRPALTLAALGGARAFIGRDDLRAFLHVGLRRRHPASIAAGLYPVPCRPRPARRFGLDIYNAAAPRGSLLSALVICLVGLTIVSVYLVNIYRVWKGKTRPVYE
jgi:cytochrome bd-type quinol oxidase subunit 2